MKIGVNTYLWTDRFLLGDVGLIEHLKHLGADGIEFASSGLDSFPTAAVRKELHRLRMGCTLCTSPPGPELSVIHHSPTARADAIRYLQQAIRTAAEIGADAVVGLLYAKVGWFTGQPRTPQEWGWAVAAFRALGPLLQQLKVTLAIEPVNRWETFFLNTAADGVSLCDAIGDDRVGLLLDTAHMIIEEKNQPQAIRASAKYLQHVHVAENDRGIPGTGQTDWSGILKALHDINYDKWCVLESFSWNHPTFSSATRTWRALANSPDAFVREGIDFVRQMSDRSSQCDKEY